MMIQTINILYQILYLLICLVNITVLCHTIINIYLLQSFIMYTPIPSARIMQTDSDSDEQPSNLQTIYSELIPAFYQYRHYLSNILQQLQPNIKSISHLIYPASYYQQKIERCRQENELNDRSNSKKFTRQLTRNYLTEKIMYNRQKAKEEEFSLMKKYQNKEKEELSGENGESLVRELPTSEIRYKVKNGRKSGEKNVEEKKGIVNDDDEGKNVNNNKKLNKVNSGNSIKRVEMNKEDNEHSLRSSKIMEKANNSNIKLVRTDSIYGNGQDHKSFKILQQQPQKIKNRPPEPPKIKTKYQSKMTQTKSNQNILNNNNNFEEQVHPNSIDKKQLKNNIVEIEQYQTCSQQGQKQSQKQSHSKFDTYSQRASTKFLMGQIKKIEEQKEKVEILKNEVVSIFEKPDSFTNQQIYKSNSNQFLLDVCGMSPKPPLIKAYEQGVISSIRYIFLEICELNSRAECYKFVLKNKQYQLLKILCNEEIGKGPIFAKQLSKGINSFIKDSDRSKTCIISNLIFNGQAYISFDQFGQVFSTVITKNQYDLLCKDLQRINHHETAGALSKLFSIWLQLYYFEIKAKKTSLQNSNRVNQTIGKMKDKDNLLNIELMKKFIYSSSYNRLNKLKVELYFIRKFPNLSVQSVLAWLRQSLQFK